MPTSKEKKGQYPVKLWIYSRRFTRKATSFFVGAFITRIVRDQSFPKAEFIPEEAINVDGIKTASPQKGIGMKMRMGSEETREEGAKAAEPLMVLSFSGESDKLRNN